MPSRNVQRWNVKLDAAGLSAARQPHPHEDSLAEVGHFLKGVLKFFPSLKPTASPPHELFPPVVVVGVRDLKGLVHLGVRMERLGDLREAALAVHLP